MSIKNIFIGKKVKYNDEHDLYTLQMVHRRFPWWILLLLLIPLLFIRCNRNLTVVCTDEGRPVANEEVQLEYTSHYLLSKKVPHEETELTDSSGEAHFRLKCSVYSYIFHCLARGHASVNTKCFVANKSFFYHYTRKVHLDLMADTEDLLVKLVDLETNDPLAGGTVIIRYRNGDGNLITDSAKTDPAGVATFDDMRACMTIDTIFGSCYGYHDSLRVDVGADELHNPDVDQPLPLRPMKESFTFFVKSEVTRQPIPGADCTVTLISPNGTQSSVKVTTSIDGRGVAVCPPVRILDIVKIHAEHPHFYPGDLEDCKNPKGPWQVQKFIKQPDSIRTVWLKPKPYTEEFRDVDSLTGAPIPGVTNEITLTSANGQTKTDRQISNSNGCFTVSAEEDDQVEVYATKSPTYQPTTKRFGVYRDIKDKRVPMMPNNVKPCNASGNSFDGTVHEESYNMGKQEGDVTINLDFYSIPDYITVYDGIGKSGTKLVDNQLLDYKHTITVHFTQGAITIVIVNSNSDSSGEYYVNCP